PVVGNHIPLLGVTVAPPTATANTPKIWFDPVYRQEFDNNSLATQTYYNDGLYVAQSFRAIGAEVYAINARNSMNGNAVEMTTLHPTNVGSQQFAQYEELPVPVYPAPINQTTVPTSLSSFLGPTTQLVATFGNLY